MTGVTLQQQNEQTVHMQLSMLSVDHVSFSSTVISGIIHLLFGIGMITMPVLGASLIMMVTGAYLIAAGVMVILSSCVFMDL